MYSIAKSHLVFYFYFLRFYLALQMLDQIVHPLVSFSGGRFGFHSSNFLIREFSHPPLLTPNPALSDPTFIGIIGGPSEPRIAHDVQDSQPSLLGAESRCRECVVALSLAERQDRAVATA